MLREMVMRWGGLPAVVAAALVAACGPAQSNGHSPRTAGSTSTSSDAGLPQPKPSSQKGIIVPSDTGIGAGPPGSPSDTGTSGRAAGPNLGN